MTDELVLVDESRTGVIRLTLNRPARRNALSVEMLESLAARLRGAEERGARVVVLDANGPVFCAGLDLKEAADPHVAEQSATLLADVFRRLMSSSFVSLCVANGPAIGGGVGLVLACDLAIIADSMTLAFPELRRGIVPALVAVLLRRKVADGVARSMLLTGRPMAATDAMRYGLVHETAAAGELPATVERCLGDILAGGPNAILLTKSLLLSLDGELDAAFAAAHEAHVASRKNDEFVEGSAAFREKRSPHWVLT